MTKRTNVKNNTLVNKAIYFIIFAFLFILPAFTNVINFIPSSEGSYEEGAYTISAYNVDIDVNEKNVLDIEETITVNPNELMRGIIRAIPVYQTVSFEENQKEYNLNYKTQIKNIAVASSEGQEEALRYEEDGYVFVRIGQENVFFNTPKTYTIKYTLNLGDDRISEFDQLYFNVIGTDWDSPISNISFNITMPKQLSEGKQMFVFSGDYGSEDEQTVQVNEDLKTFSYSYTDSLQSYQGLTIRLALDEDYFDFSTNQTIAWIVSIAVLAVFAILFIVFVIKSLKIKPQIITPVVMFNSPDNLPPSELGYIIDGVVDNQDITSLIIFWAEKGYLKIEEDNKKYTLIKEKEIETNDYQASIFNQMFSSSDEVALEKVGEKIFIQVHSAKDQIKSKHQSTHFDLKNKKQKNFFAFLAIALQTAVATRLLSITVKPYLQLGVALLGIVALGLAQLFMYQEQTKFKKSLDQTKDKTFLYMLPMLAIWALVAFLSLDTYYDKIAIAFIAIVPSTVIMLNAFKLSIRKEEGLEVFGQVLGFKQFIQFTEKDRIELLAKENPQMFYTVLPYAYVLGVSDEWINKFEGIKLTPPSWYYSTSNFSFFDYLVMRSIFNSIMLSSISQMAYTPVNVNNTRGKGGGGFGGFGGGFTGGGFGGGGGRGW